MSSWCSAQEAGPEIDETVAEARNHILSLGEDWDGEGSPPFQEETFDRAAAYLRQLHETLEFPRALKADIQPLAGEGSIGLHWREQGFQLLIIFRANGSMSYYGDSQDQSNCIKGASLPKPAFLACWIG